MNPATGNDFWDAALRLSSHETPNDDAPAFVPDHTWRPLRQNWFPSGAGPHFQPGWARVTWTPTHLLYETVFAGSSFRNAARTLNEFTWELGDVCEVFLEAPDRSYYLEVHATPENQRLQLRFPHGGITEVRQGHRRIEEFLVADPAWVHSAVRFAPGVWRVEIAIPAKALGLSQFTAHQTLRTAVCRYDCAPPAAAPRLSSTALLSAPAFHQPPEWSRLRLQPSPV